MSWWTRSGSALRFLKRSCPGPPSRLVLPLESRGDPVAMSTPWNLFCLYSLKPSSPGFLRRLHSLIRYDEDERYLSTIQGPELTRLLDFLDQVRAPPFGLCQVVNQPFCRPSVPFLPMTIFPCDVYANCKPSAVTMRPYHSHTSRLVKSSGWVTIQSTVVALPMYGKAFILARECL